jgi:protein gp37
MAEHSKTEWTDSTWNPIRARNLATGKIGWHCEHVSEGCRNCYAESMNKRLGTGLDFKPGHRKDIEIFLDEKMLLAPLRWKKPRIIFVNSMSDTFADFVTDEMIDRTFAVMALCPQHKFQVLTKRAGRMRSYCEGLVQNRLRDAVEPGTWPLTRHHTDAWLDPGASIEHRALYHAKFVTLPLRNVWLGVSAEDQATADERIPLLLETPAAVRFVSLEPLLGAIDLTHVRHQLAGQSFMVANALHAADSLNKGIPQTRLDWVIVGGESGTHARPMHPQWARDLRDQCAAAGVPFFFKQWGEWRPHERDYPRNSDRAGIIYPGGRFVRRGLGDASGEGGADMFMAGKKAAGRLLDGIEHNGMPGRPGVA